MKKTLLIMIPIVSVTLLYGQNLDIRTYMERTHISPKFGVSLGYTFRDDIEVGGFYQRANKLVEPEIGRTFRSENSFCGAYFAYPLFVAKVVAVKFNVRAGVSNGENFLITPSFQVNLNPIRIISISGGVGTRSFRPTYMVGLALKLGNS